MKRVYWISLVVALVNLPWIILWWFVTRPNTFFPATIPVLFMLLIIGTVGSIILPVFLGGHRKNRWLLISALGVVNLFWCTRWIELCLTFAPDEAAYAAGRSRILRMMFLSSTTVLLGYWLVDALLRGKARASTSE